MAAQVFSGRGLVMISFKFPASGSVPVIFISLFMGFNTELSISSGNVANLLQITKEYIAKQNKYKKKKNILQL